jgi:integrase
LENNPITLVRQSAKRERLPEVLDVGEISSLLTELQYPYKAMVFLAAATGLRASELLGLQWQDVDLLQINLSRGVVHQVIGRLKTEASQKP